MKRLFLAVDLDPAVRDGIGTLVRDLREQLSAGRRGDDPISWVVPDKLHLTLHFLGNVDDRQAAVLAQDLATPLPVAPFELVLGGLGVFPLRGAPRVIWIGVMRGAGGLRLLHRLLGERLLQAGQAIEPRPFRGHLTLGRVRGRAGPLATVLSRIEGGLSFSTPIDHVTLYQSHLSSEGSTYEPLARAPLTAGGQT